MADPRIKNVIVPASQLPAVDDLNQYIVRYRIVTEDRNRYSQWSPMFLVSGSEVSEIDADASISGRVISLVWEDEVSRPKYDIFVKFDSGDYFYHGTASATNYSLISQGTTSFQFAIQTESIDKQRNSLITIFESEVISLV